MTKAHTNGPAFVEPSTSCWEWPDPLPCLHAASNHLGSEQETDDPRSHSMLRLLDAAGFLQITCSHLAHPGLDEAGTRLCKAAASFMLDAHTSLATRLWTKPHDLWNGTIANILTTTKRGFICIYADDAGPNGLFWKRATNLRLDDPLTGNFVAGGPWLVLGACEKDWTGTVRLSAGVAQAVVSAAIPFPVQSSLERRALVVLVALCERFEARGFDTNITRSLANERLGDIITLRLTHCSYPTIEATFTCKAEIAAANKRACLITEANIKGHTWLNKLYQQLSG